MEKDRHLYVVEATIEVETVPGVNTKKDADELIRRCRQQIERTGKVRGWTVKYYVNPDIVDNYYKDNK